MNFEPGRPDLLPVFPIAGEDQRLTRDFTMKRIREAWQAGSLTVFYLNTKNGSVFAEETKSVKISESEDLKLLWIGPEQGRSRPSNLVELNDLLKRRIDDLRILTSST